MWDRNINWLPLECPQPGTWQATQVCSLTRNQISNLSVCRDDAQPTEPQHSELEISFISYLRKPVCHHFVTFLCYHKPCVHVSAQQRKRRWQSAQVPNCLSLERALTSHHCTICRLKAAPWPKLQWCKGSKTWEHVGDVMGFNWLTKMYEGFIEPFPY